MSQAGNFNTSAIIPPGMIVETLTGNTGGPVGPNGANNINIVGDGTTIQITGNPGTNTLTVVGLGGGGGDLTQLSGDSGFALPTAGVINIITGLASIDCGSSVEFVGSPGSGSTNTIKLEVTDTNGNTIIGLDAGNGTITGAENVVLGYTCASLLSSGSLNVMVGQGVGTSLTTGSRNVLLGSSSGSAYTSSESNNILINNLGIVADSNTLRIGAGTGTGFRQLNKSFIAGIRGIAPTTADGIPVFIASDGQLGTVGSGILSSISGDTGGPQTGPAITFTGTASGKSVSFAGAANTLTFDVTDNNHNTTIGNIAGDSLTSGVQNTALGQFALDAVTTGSNNIAIGYNSASFHTGNDSNNICINSLGAGGQSNALRIGSATGTGPGNLNKSFIQGIRGITPITADGIPVFIGSQGQLGTVGNGGTSLISTITGNTGSVVVPASGNVNILGGAGITTSGSGSTLTISATGSVGALTLNNDSGSSTESAGIIQLLTGNATLNSGSSVLFRGVGNQTTLDMTDSKNNTMIGKSAGNLSISGTINTALGRGAGNSLTSGASNTLIGSGSGNFLQDGISNTFIGTSSAPDIEDGAYNTIVGASTGTNYIGAESSNIIIGYNNLGTASESNVLRIGSATGTGNGQLNKSFIQGIRGITPSAGDGIPVYIDSSGQLGTVGANAISFFAYLANPVLNVTGNGDLYTIAYDTLSYNNGGGFNIGTSIFTAPVTGLYNFSVGVNYGLLGASNTFGNITLTATSSPFLIFEGNYANTRSAAGNFSVGNNVYVKMTAGDTIFVETLVAGGTKTVALFGSASAIGNFFSGSLV